MEELGMNISNFRGKKNLLTTSKTHLPFLSLQNLALLNPQYFFILGKSFYSLSHIFVLKIIDDKIIKIK